MLFSCASVATQQEQYEQSIPLVRQGEYVQAAEIIESAKGVSYVEKDRVLFYLDLGMVLHWAGDYEGSNEALSKAEQGIEDLYTKSVSKAVASGLLNDNALDYSGEDYEDIYLNVFKALNYIALGDEDAARVEIRRVQIKLNLLDDKYKDLVEEYNSSEGAEAELVYRENQFHNDVLSRYLSLLLYRAEGSVDDARIDRDLMDEAWKTQSHIYRFDKPDFPPLEFSEDGLAHVNVLSFTGLGPVKLAETLYLDTGPDIVYITMTGQDDDYVSDLVGFNFLFVPGIDGGMHFKIQFPKLSSRRSEADRVVVRLDGEVVAELPLLEKLENVARETFLLKQPVTVAKTIVRATLKNVAKEIGKDALQDSLADQGDGGFFLGVLAGFAADVAVDATENADLRIAQFFPAEAWAGEFTVEPGIYDVVVEYWNGSTLMEEESYGEMEFLANELNLIESHVLR